MSDVDVVKKIYAAMAARDLLLLFELLDPQCVITQDSRLPWGGRFLGHDGFAAFGAALTSAISSSVTTEALFEADGDVIQFGRTRGKTVLAARGFDIPEVHRWPYDYSVPGAPADFVMQTDPAPIGDRAGSH